MKTTRKMVCLLLLALLMSLSLTGQGYSEGAGDVKTVRVLTMDPGNQFIRWEDRAEYPVWQAVERLFAEAGIKLEVELVASEQYEVVIQTRMAAASSLPDIVDVSPLDASAVIKLGGQGIIQPLTGLIDAYSNGNIAAYYTEKYPSAYPLTKTTEGEMYWFSNLLVTNYMEMGIPEGVGRTIVVRRDWLDKLGLEAPATTEAFKDMLIKLREGDANGNGKADETFLLNFSVFSNALAQSFGLGYGNVSVDPVTRTAVSPWYQEGVKDYISYVRELIALGLIDTSTMGNYELSTQRKAENIVSASYEYGMAAWIESEVQNTQGVVFQPLAPLQALEGVTPYAVKEPADLVWNKFIITQNCMDVETAIAFFDVVYSDAYFDLVNYGIEGQTYDVVDGVKVVRSLGTWEEMAAARNTTFQSFNPFPKAMMRTLDDQINACLANENTRLKGEYQQALAGYTFWYPDSIDNFLAMATDEEAAIISELTNEIKTYSEELLTKLCLGDYAMDDWDEYMQKFDDLGLPQLLEVYQRRVDRFYDLQNQ